MGHHENHTTGVQPKYTGAQVWTLAAYAATASLLFLLLDGQLQVSHSPQLQAIWRAVPAMGGVVVLSYLEAFRSSCLRVCGKWWVKVIGFGALAAVLAVSVGTFNLKVAVPPGSRVTVDDTYSPRVPGTDIQTIRVKGLGSHRIRVSEKGSDGEVYMDEIDISPTDMLRLWARTPTSLKDEYRVASSRRLSVNAGGAARFLFVSGRDFPEFYLRSIEREANVQRPGDTTIVTFQLLPENKLLPKVRVPIGKFRVAVDSLPCTTAPRSAVITFGSHDETFDFAEACR